MKKKKITIVTNYKFPNDAATANRLAVLADVLTRHTDYQIIIVGKGANRENFKLEGQDISVCQLEERTFNKKNLFIRGINELIFSFKLLSVAKKTEAEIYLVSIPSITLLISSIMLKGSPVVYDLRDLIWEYLIRTKGSRKYAGLVLRKISLNVLKKGFFITVTNDAELKYLEANGFSAVHQISNGISQKKFDEMAKFNLKKYDKRSDYLITYVGNVGLAQNLKSVIEVVGNLNGFKLIIIGSGIQFYELTDYINKNAIKNVALLGFKPWNEAVEYVKNSDCLLGQIGPEFETAVPSKIYEYAISGRSVLFGLPKGPGREIAKNLYNFYVYHPDNPTELLNLFFKLRSNVITKREVDLNRDIKKKNYIRETEAKKLSSLLLNYTS